MGAQNQGVSPQINQKQQNTLISGLASLYDPNQGQV
jgi:hypothetical protein